MDLGGQAGQRGYAMAALLMSVAVMAIVMSAVLPVWRQQSQREKEAELAFRGEQYARAIYLFNRKNGGQNPPSIDALVQGRYLRKKYKDPMTEEGEFQPLAAGANQPGIPGGGANPPGRGGGSSGGSATGGRGPSTVSSPAGVGNSGRGGPGPGLGGESGIPGGVQGGGGILRVVSKSKEASIRIYYGAAHYNEWQFMYNRQGRGGGPGRGGPGGGPTQGRPGTVGPGAGPGGASGGRGGGPGAGPGGFGTGPAGGARGGGPGGARGGGPGRGGRSN